MQQNNDLTCLEALIAGIGGADYGSRSPGPCGLLLEHLQAARRDLLGSQRNEYLKSLESAQESVSCIVDKGARNDMKKRLKDLIAPPSAG